MAEENNKGASPEVAGTSVSENPAPQPQVDAVSDRQNAQQYSYTSQPGQPMNEQTGVPYGARQNPQYNPQPNYGYGQQNNQYAPQPQYAQQGYQARSAGFGSPQKDKWVATLLALFPPLGMFGIHKFYLGYKTEGLIMLLVAVLGTCVAFGPLVMTVIAIIEGVRYVTLTQEDFEATYVRGSKGWL